MSDHHGQPITELLNGSRLFKTSKKYPHLKAGDYTTSTSLDDSLWKEVIVLVMGFTVRFEGEDHRSIVGKATEGKEKGYCLYGDERPDELPHLTDEKVALMKLRR